MAQVKIYLDDIRPAPEGWELCRTVSEAIEMLSYVDSEQSYEISLDFDLGMTTKDCEHCGNAGWGRFDDPSHPDYCEHCTHEISTLDQAEPEGIYFLHEIIDKHKKYPSRNWLPEKIYLHTANPRGRAEMRWVIADMEVMFGVEYPEAFR